MASNLSVDHSPRPVAGFGIRPRMLLSFGLLLSISIGLVIYVMVFGIPYSNYSGSYGQQRSNVFRNLSLVADLEQARLDLWLRERQNDVETLTESERMLSSVQHVVQLVLQNLAAGKSTDELKDILLKDEKVAQMTWVLQVFQGAHHPYDEILIAESKTGVILASSDVRQLGNRIAPEKLSFYGTAASDHMSVTVSDDAPNGKRELIVAKSMLDKFPAAEGQDITLAVAILRVGAEKFVEPMLYAGGGLGKTGEIVLVGQEGLNLISLKLPMPDGTKPEPKEYRFVTKHSRTTILDGHGTVSVEDYRGVPVLAVYRHVKVAPGSDWNMVVKVDEAEVMAPLWQNAIWSFVTGLAGLAAIMALAAFSAQRILRPVRNLSRTAEEVERGNLTVRARVERKDEIGALATTFNSMIDRIQNWHTELEQQVKDRTSRLNQLNEELLAEIAERKRAEKNLAAERQRLEVTLRSIADGVITTDTDGLVVSLNAVGEILTGWKETEVVSRPIREVFHVVNETSRKRCDDPVKHVLSTGQTSELVNDVILIARDGTERILADICAPVRDDEGTVYGAVLVFRDITFAKLAEKALTESEERFRQLADNVQEVFWLSEIGRPKQIAYLNPAHEKLWGFPPSEVYKDNGAWPRSIHEGDRERVESAYDLFLDGQGDYDVEFRIVRPDGSMRWVWDRAFAVRDDNAEIVRVGGLTQDITLRKIDEQRLEQMVEEIKHFAYIVSHDLRAPLINLKGFKEELCHAIDIIRPLAHKAMPRLTEKEKQVFTAALDGDIPEALQFIEASVFRMNNLIAAILNLSRLGNRELDLVSLNMNQIVTETLQTLAHQINQRGVEVKVHSLPAIVADRTSMEQIVSNLLTNAINYLDPERPGVVEIWSGPLGADVAFHFRDNGVGIEPENRGKIFDVFQRVRKLDVAGEGLGLACAKILVQRHGGRIWCESEPGRGSTFTFTISPRLATELETRRQA
jgi:PAS domain S-box-containing protein